MLAIRPVCWGQHVSLQLHLHCHASGKASGTARDSLFTSRSDLPWAQGSSSAFISPMSDNNTNTLREGHALSSSWRHEHVSTCSLHLPTVKKGLSPLSLVGTQVKGATPVMIRSFKPSLLPRLALRLTPLLCLIHLQLGWRRLPPAVAYGFRNETGCLVPHAVLPRVPTLLLPCCSPST
jgi:hypothetical protein